MKINSAKDLRKLSESKDPRFFNSCRCVIYGSREARDAEAKEIAITHLCNTIRGMWDELPLGYRIDPYGKEGTMYSTAFFVMSIEEYDRLTNIEQAYLELTGGKSK